MIRELDGNSRHYEYNAVGVGDIIKIPRAVVTKWTIKEIAGLEGICEMILDTKSAWRWHNMLYHFSWYKICRSKDGRVILKRIRGSSVIC